MCVLWIFTTLYNTPLIMGQYVCWEAKMGFFFMFEQDDIRFFICFVRILVFKKCFNYEFRKKNKCTYLVYVILLFFLIHNIAKGPFNIKKNSPRRAYFVLKIKYFLLSRLCENFKTYDALKAKKYIHMHIVLLTMCTLYVHLS